MNIVCLTRTDPPDVLIEMTKPKNGRRVQVISSILHAMRMRHVARVPFWRPGLLPAVMHKRLARTGCSVVWHSPLPESLFITDDPARGLGRKRILVSYDTSPLHEGKVGDGTLALPILFNPALLDMRSYALADELAIRRDRPIKIIFAGNCDPKAYDSPEISRRYGLLSRHKLHEMVTGSFADALYVPETFEQLMSAAAVGDLRRRFVWVDTRRFSIPMSSWLQVMSMSEYFFCAPGVAYPYCHNFNESAACGCVPILQYREWLHPRLEHGRNCLSFTSLSDLAGLVPDILGGGGDPSWPERSAAIIDYHRNHLSLDVCMRRIREFVADPTRQTMTWIMAGKD